MNIQQAKQIRLVDLLDHLGYSPTHTANAGDDVWYFSPFRKESTPSFHISLKHNCWFDFGESSKGDNNSIIDFVMRYRNTDVRGALSYLGNIRISPSKIMLSEPVLRELFDPGFEIGSSKVEVIKVSPLYSYPLKNYLKDDRCIDLELGYKYLKEVKYRILEGERQGKEFYSLGFQNQSGGWALRNKHFKTATKPNDISVIETGSGKVSVYEGFINFLSHLAIKGNMSPATDIIILNSNSLKEYGKNFIIKKGYKEVYSFLDNDSPGKKTFEYFKTELPLVVDCSEKYAHYNDLNELLVEKRKNIKAKH